MRNSKSHWEETVNPNLNVNGYEEHWTLKSVKMSFNNERHSYEKLAKENAYITRRSLMLHGRRKSSNFKNIYSWKSSVCSRKKQANKESRQWVQAGCFGFLLTPGMLVYLLTRLISPPGKMERNCLLLRLVVDARVKVEQVRVILSWDFHATEWKK